MFRMEFLPAAHGDAIWIEYGSATKPRRIVIDGGPAATYERGLHKRLLQLPPGKRAIDLFVVTHIDADHIDGAIILLREAAQRGVRIGEIWFNAWAQISKFTTDHFEAQQGEFLGALLDLPAWRKVWNPRTKGAAIVVPDEGPLPRWVLPGDASITLLSPGVRQVQRLRARWSSALRDFSPGDTAEALRRLESRRDYRPPEAGPVFGEKTFGDDRSVANGSSIAFLLEQGGKSCLLAGDAHPRVLAASIRRLLAERGGSGKLHLDACKLAHHGSMSNINDELLALLDCRRWIVSTNGAIFKHPDRPTAELIAKHSRQAPELLCNYLCDTTRKLADTAAQARWKVLYPGQGAHEGPAGGVMLDLAASTGQARP